MNYDSMSVEDLIERVREIGVYHEWYGDDDLGEVTSALRKAVIREASVGVITFDSAIPEPIYEMSLDLDGDYDLIPHKETP